MPIGESEHHPYLEKGLVSGASRLILGSFPVYECSGPDNPRKQHIRKKEGTVQFFYGSADSEFWCLYARHVDKNIAGDWTPDVLRASLANQKISISDLILSCERHMYSSEDVKLLRKNWNRAGIIRLIEGGVSKILCTSKGVLRDLERKVLCSGLSPVAILQMEASIILQDELLEVIEGSRSNLSGRIASVFSIKETGNVVEAISIPSPGSPQRQLRRFGLDQQDPGGYARDYFKMAFKWLLE